MIKLSELHASRYKGLTAVLTRVEDEREVSWVLVVVDSTGRTAVTTNVIAAVEGERALLLPDDELKIRGA